VTRNGSRRQIGGRKGWPNQKRSTRKGKKARKRPPWMRSAHIWNQTLLPEAQISVVDKMITITELLEKRTKELEGKLEAGVAAITQLGVKQNK
jgi:hypothetical protein